MYDPAWSDGKPVDTEVTEGVVGGGVEAAKVVGGVGEDTGACWECTEGVEGSGCGVR